MKPSTVKIIIFFASFALLGLVITQTFWIKEEINIAKKQFDHRVDNALMDVNRELRDFNDSATRFSSWMNNCSVPHEPKDIFDVLDTALLKVLLRKYTDYHKLDSNYYYSIVKTEIDSVVYRSGNYPYSGNAANTYKSCLSNVWKDAYYHISITFPEKNKAVLLSLSLWLGLTFLFLIIIALSVAIIIITYLRQKKLSEMKNDFINNITHEFKTPVSTIALASEVLIKSDPAEHPERVRKYAGIIADENERMRLQIERVLEVAQQDYHEIKLNITDIDIHQLLNSVVPNLCLEKSNKEVSVQYNLNAQNYKIRADLMFVTGIISNITENAVKYSGQTPELIVKTIDYKNGIQISFIDNGIGMGKEAIRHVFDKFYRVPTGNVHNVKGFGLGLYYAKTMAEAHGGTITASSELNKGSRFDVYLPVNMSNFK